MQIGFALNVGLRRKQFDFKSLRRDKSVDRFIGWERVLHSVKRLALRAPLRRRR